MCGSSSGRRSGRYLIPIEIVVNTCLQQLCTLVGAWHLLLCLTHRTLKEAARFVFLAVQRFVPALLCVCSMHSGLSVILFKGMNLKKKRRKNKKTSVGPPKTRSHKRRRSHTNLTWQPVVPLTRLQETFIAY